MQGGLVAAELRRLALQNGGGFTCNQFYGTGPTSSLFHNLLKMNYCNSININIDETDNNTAANSNNNNNNNNNNNSNNHNHNHNDLLQIGCLKPRYIMDDIFHREDERLKTFASWPLDWLNKNELAMTGMFFMGEGDKCKCYFCEVEIGRWEREDQPVSEHLRWSPNCPLLRRRTTNNVPISAEELERILPAPSYDICGLNDTIEVRPNAYADMPSGSLGPSTSRNTSCMSTGIGSGIAYYPEFREYAIETARLRSFGEWPRHMKQKPIELAEAGFFYTGMGDRVKCFSCGGGLKDWDEFDDPWEQHALWMSKCRYLKLMKGQSYIDSVIAAQKAKETEKMESIGEIAVNTEVENSSADKTLSTLIAERNRQQNMNTSSSNLIKNDDSNIIKNHNNDSDNYDDKLTMLGGDDDIKKMKNQASIPEEKLCKICYAGEYNTAFLPCGHVVACAKCASSVTKCPMCRKPFTDVMRVYFS